MATYGKKLLDSEGNIILPKTRSSLVYMDDNSTVEDKISSILSEITKIKDGSTVVGLSKVFLDATNPDIKYFLYASDSGNSDSPVVLYDVSSFYMTFQILKIEFLHMQITIALARELILHICLKAEVNLRM